MDSDGADKLEASLRAGALLLAHGAESWRTEDTMRRMLVGLDAAEVEAVATATVLYASVVDTHGVQTKIRRVRSGPLNLSIIQAVNDLSRRVAAGQHTAQEVLESLTEIERGPPLYAVFTQIQGALLASAGFALLFGGSALDMVAALPGAAALTALLMFLERARLPGLPATALAALVGTVVTVLVSRAMPGVQSDVAIRATVVLLVPGASIANAIGDLLGGHLLSGLARGAAAGLVAAAIAAGAVVGLRLTGAAI